jgi:hypothetical protein
LEHASAEDGISWTGDHTQWTDIVDIAVVGNSALFGLRKDGSIVFEGFDKGYAEVLAWTDMKDIEAARGLIVGLQADGNLLGFGETEFVKKVYDIANWGSKADT